MPPQIISKNGEGELHLIPLLQLENHIGSIFRAINIYPTLHPPLQFMAHKGILRTIWERQKVVSL